jgi:hypothetical protein
MVRRLAVLTDFQLVELVQNQSRTAARDHLYGRARVKIWKRLPKTCEAVREKKIPKSRKSAVVSACAFFGSHAVASAMGALC